MKTHILSFTSLLLLLTTNAFAQKTVTANGNTYTITSGNCTMLVDGDRGGKVISLKCGDAELIAQHKAKTEQMRFENPNDFGSTFWPSPQSNWNWPPIATYDSKPYKATTTTGGSVTLTSAEDEKYPYVFTKTFKPLGKGTFEINYSIKNIGGSDVKVAPWEITRVPGGGIFFFEAPEVRPLTEMTYTTEMGWQWVKYISKERVNRKIFADSKGWLAYADNGLLFVKQFPDIATGKAAPGEDEFELYFNMGNTYTEIENQGEYTLLHPGDSLNWRVLWTLVAVDKNADKTTLKSLTEKIMK